MTPEEIYWETFREAFKQMWDNAAVMILAIIFLLGISAGIAIWLEWKVYSHSRFQ